MADLRKKFQTILRKYGHDVYLQRRISPYESENVEYADSLEKHTTRHMYASNKGLPATAQENIEGITHDSELIYYFKHDAIPREGDRIYENLSGYPDNLVTWLIDFVVPMRFKTGRIEYWAVGASREEPSS